MCLALQVLGTTRWLLSANVASCNRRLASSTKDIPQVKTFTSRSDAEAWARQIEFEIDRVIFASRAEAESITLTEAIDRYARDIASSKKGYAQEASLLRIWKNTVKVSGHWPQSRALISPGCTFAAAKDQYRHLIPTPFKWPQSRVTVNMAQWRGPETLGQAARR